MTKVMVLGIDGGTWDLLRPLAEEGRMPALRRILREGCWGTLRSTHPPVTGPAWVSFATGMRPEHHGIFDFVKFRPGSYRTSIVTTRDVNAPFFYEHLSAGGLKCVIINLPLSYPPRGISGVYVADWLAPEMYIYPEEKKHYLEGYRHVMDFMKKGPSAVDDLVEMVRAKRRLASRIMDGEEWDLLFLLLSESDWCSHRFWREMGKGSRLGKRALDVFSGIDTVVDLFLENMDADTTLFLVSDHGFADISRTFFMNTWLMENGLLATGWVENSRTEYRGVFEIVIERQLRPLRLPPTVVRFILERCMGRGWIRRLVRAVYWILYGEMRLQPPVRETIDFERTLAFVPTSENFGIYINSIHRFEGAKIRTEGEYLALRERLTEMLKGVGGGRLIRDAVILSDGNGQPLETAPDILVFPADGVGLDTLAWKGGWLVNRDAGYHHPDGIFAAYGRSVRANPGGFTGDIYDIAPTLLHMFGLPVPEDMDGRVLREVFREDSEFARRGVRRAPGEDTERERIRRAVVVLKENARI